MSNFQTIYIPEWTTLSPDDIQKRYGIRKLSAEDLNIVNSLETQRKISIRQLSDGIEINTTSYVGLIKLSNFQIVITPKINKLQLAQMISFTYGLEHIDYFELETEIETKSGLITDLLALLFVKETEKIMLKGLSKRYTEREENISSCRGKIVFNKLARNTTLGLTLPCRYQELTVDIPENRLLLASLIELGKYVTTSSLKRKINILSENLRKRVKYETLTSSLLKCAKQQKDRLTGHYTTVIELAEMILSGTDFSLKSGRKRFLSFLLDMNLLFEKFLYRYLAKTIEPGINIKYQKPLNNRYISSNGKEHRLIPDYSFYTNEELFAIADAKYKDYDNKDIYSGDLYQLTVYGIANRKGIDKIYLMYPSNKELIEKQYSLQIGRQKNIKIVLKGIPLYRMLDSLGNDYIVLF
ncbi:MAG: McrC family protein [bacterium]